MGVGIDDRADKCCVWADLRALADHGLAFQEASGKDHRIAFDTHVIFDPRGFRVENGHALTHPMLADTLVVSFGERCELHAVVDTFDAQRVGGGERTDGTVGFGGFECVGQVELALGVVGFEVGDRFSQQFGIEHVDGRVHFMHGQFAAVGVLLFHDAQHVAFAVADDATIASRIVKNGGEHGGSVAALLMEGKQLVQRVGVEQRHIRSCDQHRAVKTALLLQLRHGALHGSPGAGNVVLIDDGDTLIVGAGRFGDSFRLAVHDHGQRFRVERRHGVHHTVQKRLSGQSVQHFRLVGTHAGALTRRKNNRGT